MQYYTMAVMFYMKDFFKKKKILHISQIFNKNFKLALKKNISITNRNTYQYIIPIKLIQM